MAFYKNEIEVIRPTLAQGVGALWNVPGRVFGPWGGPDGIMGMNVGRTSGTTPRVCA